MSSMKRLALASTLLAIGASMASPEPIPIGIEPYPKYPYRKPEGRRYYNSRTYTTGSSQRKRRKLVRQVPQLRRSKKFRA